MEYANTLSEAADAELAARELELAAAERRLQEGLPE